MNYYKNQLQIGEDGGRKARFLPSRVLRSRVTRGRKVAQTGRGNFSLKLFIYFSPRGIGIVLCKLHIPPRYSLVARGGREGRRLALRSM